jgi:hypothetical protein
MSNFKVNNLKEGREIDTNVPRWEQLMGINANTDAVAFRIREYVTPPPIFYLQQDDLVLIVEHTRENEWERIFVFRKKLCKNASLQANAAFRTHTSFNQS